ncbi:alkaline phosphatase family protein [Nocardioides sambongensis]|uniref:hypothetical protein n=1 Tax=Nocardioides sambongensis TaxID=2589074 RepID=UPI001E5BBCFF|nr:hypothetical protein [Nocardioides sambongensis]
MFHVVDWYPTLMQLMGLADRLPTDRVIDGIDQTDFLTGEQEESNREHFMMFFDEQLVGMRYRNFKVLTHIVENGYAPIQQLATPHIYNLTVNPDENTPTTSPRSIPGCSTRSSCRRSASSARPSRTTPCPRARHWTTTPRTTDASRCRGWGRVGPRRTRP